MILKHFTRPENYVERGKQYVKYDLTFTKIINFTCKITFQEGETRVVYLSFGLAKGMGFKNIIMKVTA